ncbi:hypothetical protein [Mucilaginibacter ginsenosidivorans]|uniref:Uncharacterized protein n=1 Tax=Mucilaginibacter ginsenosidivorans TaxID=398053 RepID=A0A5B8V0G6_9SPHI|nr:hypothetical protein [Mucilaginibacter ginsenosidivorans]QEC64997.1 hypothetical protein FRZ54_21295 [Mucilaginibacter ginsenosidivorans]
MYWFKKCFIIACALFALLLVQSCKSDARAGNDTEKFFDLKKYFANESLRLAKSDPLITKTAIHNKNRETKKLRIADWATELSLFSESDINKPAWKASYKVINADGILSFTAKDPGLKTQDIVIKRQGDKIKWILIVNHTKSTVLGKVLYETTEKLSYIPDSIYQIQKRQFVRTLGFNFYSIKGSFN